jgi:hypothetical protein
MLQKIINVYNKITNADKSKKNNLEFNDKIGYHYSEFENGELFNQVLDKCITEHTDITGLEGIEKTNFITILTNKLYAEKKSYLMCSNSIRELSSHFKKHLATDNILIFCLKDDKSHNIDINYLFSLDVFLNFIFRSNIEKDLVRKKNYPTWFSFFNDDSNSLLLKNGYFYKLKELIKTGHIDDYGDLNNETSKKTTYAYLTLQEMPNYYNLSYEDKDKYIFFLNILQLSLINEEVVNILFDEGKVFFDGYRNAYIKSLTIEGGNNNLIFCSQLVDDLAEDIQTICFKGYVYKDYRDKFIDININQLTLNIKELQPGYFYLFDKQMKSFTTYPIKVPYVDEQAEIKWNLFLNNKQIKMHKQLQLDLQVNGLTKEKKLKI